MVELLVVIAIIALLMSVLMPALNKVRKQARAAICLHNLHEWGIIFNLYIQDNDQYFWCGWTGPIDIERRWFTVLKPYYGGRDVVNKGLTYCPTAKKHSDTSTCPPYGAWDPTTVWGLNQTGAVGGSYGVNGWIQNPPGDLVGGLFETKNNWRTPNVKQAGIIPAFLDAWWTGGQPFENSPPPAWDGQIDGARTAEMNRFCLNRHDTRTNCLFLDWSSRRVGLKELWVLKWHRSFNNINGPWTRAGGATRAKWPKWMQQFEEF